MNFILKNKNQKKQNNKRDIQTEFFLIWQFFHQAARHPKLPILWLRPGTKKLPGEKIAQFKKNQTV